MGAFFSDPIALKELSGLSRRWQTYLVRMAYVGLIALVLCRVWFVLESSPSIFAKSEYAEVGRRLFHDFVRLQLYFVAIVAILFGSETITRDLRRGMFGLLMLTPLTPSQIVLGKWKAVMAQSGSLILCGVPVVAICFYLGGLGGWDLLWSFCLTSAMIALASALALRESLNHDGTIAAILMTLFRLGRWTLVIWLIGGLLGDTVASYLHPLFAAEGAARAGPRAFGWMGAVLICIVWSHRCLRVAAERMEERSDESRRAPVSQGLVAGRDRLTQTLFLKGFRVLAPGGVWERYPLLWKELTTRSVSRGIHYLRVPLTAGLALLVFFLWLASQGRERGAFYGLGLLLTLLAIMSGASLFSPEKVGRKWDLLVVTLVPTWELVGTKLLASIFTPESLGLAAIGFCATVGWTWWGSVPGCILFLHVGSLFLVFGYLLAAAASLRARTPRGASAVSLSVVSVILLGSWLFPPAVVPMIHPGALLESFIASTPFGPPTLRTDCEIPFRDLLLYTGIYGSISIALALWIVLKFERMIARA